MELQKTLTSIVCVGALALNGCRPIAVYDSRYDFKGTLGNEELEFKRIDNWFLKYDPLILTVIKEDGRTITYSDLNNNLKVDRVTVNIEKDEYEIINNVVGKQALEIAQQQFDSYLGRILEYKQQKAVEHIK